MTFSTRSNFSSNCPNVTQQPENYPKNRQKVRKPENSNDFLQPETYRKLFENHPKFSDNLKIKQLILPISNMKLWTRLENDRISVIIEKSESYLITQKLPENP